MVQLIEQEKISDITGVPTQTWELLNHPERLNYDLSSLKTLGAGGAPRPAEHVKQLDSEFKSAGELIFAGYSAGAIGLGFNADLIKKYKNPKLIVDSFWLDKESRRVRKG